MTYQPTASLDAALHAILADTAARFGATATARLATFFDTLVGRREVSHADALQRPRAMAFPGLSPRAWFDGCESPKTQRVAELLAAHYAEIRAEMERATGFVSYPSTSRFSELGAGAWSTIPIWSRGRFSPQAGEFPVTAQLTCAVEPDLFPWRGEVAFLRLQPGARIPPHHDWTNAQLTCHLGLRVPERCGLVVGSEERRWEEGKALFFDHSFLHSAYNDADTHRDVLLLNLVHPELSDAEVHAIRALGQALSVASEGPATAGAAS